MGPTEQHAIDEIVNGLVGSESMEVEPQQVEQAAQAAHDGFSDQDVELVPQASVSPLANVAGDGSRQLQHEGAPAYQPATISSICSCFAVGWHGHGLSFRVVHHSRQADSAVRESSSAARATPP